MSTTAAQRDAKGFEHEALFYSGESDFVARTSALIRDSIRTAEPILVVVSRRKIDLLRAELGDHAAAVRFEDMSDLGRNPAWIIPAWADYVEEHRDTGHGFRGIGEPLTPDRGADELVECERHEALLNVAFEDGPGWRLACPYDTTAFPPRVMDVAKTNHPILFDGVDRRRSAAYPGAGRFAAPYAEPLPEPAGAVRRIVFSSVSEVRSFVHEAAGELGAASRLDDLVLAVSEIGTNSVQYGGGGGQLRMWRHHSAIVCEIRDAGLIDDPLAGRRAPDPARGSGFGLWLANRVCDLVQVRSFEGGSVIRMHVAAADASTRSG